jgi:HNH endonuclease
VKAEFERYVVDESGCWLWCGATSEGYGSVWLADEHRTEFAHRLFWQDRYGAIPDGKEIDHVCRVRRCVNPEHLRLATRRQNLTNTVSRPGSSSRYLGVCWYEQTGRWKAEVRANGRRHHLGYFQDEDEAGRVAAEFRAQHLPFSREAREMA